MTNTKSLTSLAFIDSGELIQECAQERKDIFEKNKHFAVGLNVYKFIWLFALGSVAGFIIETVWRFFTAGQLEVRSSLIFGPFNIVYGFGVVALFLAMRKIDKNKKVIIIVWGIILGTVVEYLLAVVQEKLFGTLSWDYSNLPLNIHWW